jgi:hypothetical protein
MLFEHEGGVSSQQDPLAPALALTNLGVKGTGSSLEGKLTSQVMPITLSYSL